MVSEFLLKEMEEFEKLRKEDDHPSEILLALHLNASFEDMRLTFNMDYQKVKEELLKIKKIKV